MNVLRPAQLGKKCIGSNLIIMMTLDVFPHELGHIINPTTHVQLQIEKQQLVRNKNNKWSNKRGESDQLNPAHQFQIQIQLFQY